MHGVGEHHHLVAGQYVQEAFMGLDEGLLPGLVELSRHRLRLAVLHPQTMKQRNQPRPALMDDGELPFDPRPDMACRARQHLGDSGSQPLPLLGAQMTAAALVAEPDQPLGPVFPVEPEPRAKRIVVEQKYRPDLRATHPPIQQHERIAAPRQTTLD